MRRYRSLPVEVEAVQFTGDVGTPEIDALDLGCAHDPDLGVDVLTLRTPEGVMRARPGDWVVRNTEGDLYVCPNRVFRAKYAPAEPAPGE